LFELNVLVLAPVLLPLTIQVYVGELPPLTGAAVKLTVVPEQILLALAVTDIEGVTTGFTVTVRLFDVTVLCDIQLAFEVSWQATTTPLARELLAKLELLVPALRPFTVHW
jgi:hypothetical protein